MKFQQYNNLNPIIFLFYIVLSYFHLNFQLVLLQVNFYSFIIFKSSKYDKYYDQLDPKFHYPLHFEIQSLADLVHLDFLRFTYNLIYPFHLLQSLFCFLEVHHQTHMDFHIHFLYILSALQILIPIFLHCKQLAFTKGVLKMLNSPLLFLLNPFCVFLYLKIFYHLKLKQKLKLFVNYTYMDYTAMVLDFTLYLTFFLKGFYFLFLFRYIFLYLIKFIDN